MGLTGNLARANQSWNAFTHHRPPSCSPTPPPWTPPTDPQVREELRAHATDLEQYGLLHVTRAQLAKWNRENPPPPYHYVVRRMPPQYFERPDIIRWREDVAAAVSRHHEDVLRQHDANSARRRRSSLTARGPLHQSPASGDEPGVSGNLEESRRRTRSSKIDQQQLCAINARQDQSALRPTDPSLYTPNRDSERVLMTPLVRVPTCSAGSRTHGIPDAWMLSYHHPTLPDGERRRRDDPIEVRQPSGAPRNLGQSSGEKRRRASDPKAEKRRCRFERSGLGRSSTNDDGRTRRALDARDPLYRFSASAGHHRQTASEPEFTKHQVLKDWLSQRALPTGYDKMKQRGKTICLEMSHMISGSWMAARQVVMSAA